MLPSKISPSLHKCVPSPKAIFIAKILLTTAFIILAIALLIIAKTQNYPSNLVAASITCLSLSLVFLSFTYLHHINQSNRITKINKAIYTKIKYPSFLDSFIISDTEYKNKQITLKKLPSVRNPTNSSIIQSNRFKCYNSLLCNLKHLNGLSKASAQKTFMRKYNDTKIFKNRNNNAKEALAVLFPFFNNSTTSLITKEDLRKCLRHKKEIQDVIKTNLNVFLTYYGVELTTNTPESCVITVYDIHQNRINEDFIPQACSILKCLGTFKMNNELMAFKKALTLIFNLHQKQTNQYPNLYSDSNFLQPINNSFITARKMILQII